VAWSRYDDEFPDHPKVVALGDDEPLALLLFIRANARSARYGTDGLVTRDSLVTLSRRIPDVCRIARRLVEVGLWESCPEGFRVHDFLEYHMSADEVRRRRKLASDRQKRRRLSSMIAAETRASVTQSVTRDSRVSSPPRPDPTRPDQREQEEERGSSNPTTERAALASRSSAAGGAGGKNGRKPRLPEGFEEFEAAGPSEEVVRWAEEKLSLRAEAVRFWHAEFCDAVRAGRFARLPRDLEAALRNSLTRNWTRQIPQTAPAGSMRALILGGGGRR